MFGGYIKQEYAGELEHVWRLHQARICWRARACLEVASSRDIRKSYSTFGGCIKQRYNVYWRARACLEVASSRDMLESYSTF